MAVVNEERVPLLLPSHPRSPSPPPTSSPLEIPRISNMDYHPLPDDMTIVHHPPFNLPALGIAINLNFHCVVCLTCQRGLDPSALLLHWKRDHPIIDVPEELPTVLQTTYQLVSLQSITYSKRPIPPVFGIPVQEEPYYFCECGKGSMSYESLRSHQTRSAYSDQLQCPLHEKKPSYHMGYAQRLASNKPFFEVDIRCWRLACEDYSCYHLAYSQSLPPLRDYSQMNIKGAEDEMNTSSFFYTQRWLRFLDGYKPEEIREVYQMTATDAPFGDKLRAVGEAFLLRSNEDIEKHNTFGLLNLIGQTTERGTVHRFDSVTKKTVQKYALTLHRLIFGVLRQLDPSYAHKYRYPPLDPTQIVPLKALLDALDDEHDIEELVELYQAACFSLFAHHQHKYATSRDLDQFFSPVICFLVASSVREQGGFELASVITQRIAHISFAIRAVMFHEIVKKSKKDSISCSECVFLSYH